MAKTKQPRHVIFDGPQKQRASGACYLALDGYWTILKSKAARLQSFADAKAFDEGRCISLNDHTYINQEDLTDGELEGQAPFE